MNKFDFEKISKTLKQNTPVSNAFSFVAFMAKIIDSNLAFFNLISTFVSTVRRNGVDENLQELE